MISAIIVAAGQGKRMGGDRPKQFLPLAGRPLIVHCIKAFDKVPAIDALVLVVADGYIDECRNDILPAIDLTKPLTLVKGGSQRQASVYNGLISLRNDDGIVLIHDGVRPLVSTSLIENCIKGAHRWGACVPGILPVDTLKSVTPEGLVNDTIPRENLRKIQTPQAFKNKLIREAHTRAMQEHWICTDDAGLVERLGKPVYVIPGETANIKITSPLDMVLGEALLSNRS